jgi:hypothetical protein
MNFTKMMVISICSLSLATAAIAQDSSSSRDLEPTAAEDELINLGWRASKLRGDTVYNEAREKVGSIDDFIITKDGHLVFAIVNIGGFLGYGSYKVAVPVEKFSQIVPKAILPGATRDKLRQLRRFDYQILVGPAKGAEIR